MKSCCTVQFRIFTENSVYTELESFIMSLVALSITKDPKNPVKKMLRKQAKMLYDCCKSPSKLSHSFGELVEHSKYVNRENLENAKEVWKKGKKKK